MSDEYEYVRYRSGLQATIGSGGGVTTRPVLGDDGYTAKDIATMAHERALQARLDRARAIYQREIRNHAHPGTRAALELNAGAIIETIAGCLPLEETTTV